MLEERGKLRFGFGLSRASHVGRRSILAFACTALGVMTAGAFGQMPSYSIDFQGPTIGVADSFTGVPISEGDILIPGSGLPAPGPGLPVPGTVGNAGFTGASPDLGLPAYPLPPYLPGVPNAVEVDALSYGMDLLIDPAMPPHEILWTFSVDEYAVGIPGGPTPPDVTTEGTTDSSSDIYISFPPGLFPPFPSPPGAVGPGNTMLFDGDGVAPPVIPALPILPPLPPGFFFGIGLVEPHFPFPLATVPDNGDNLDALDVDTVATPIPFPVYFSLDAGFADTLEPFPPVNSGSAVAQPLLGFVGGDILVTAAPGGPPAVYVPAATLGLDGIIGPDSDDVDALILVENGVPGYQQSVVDFDWVGGATDMLMFSVRRASAIIGTLDSRFATPIEEGDILTPPLAGSPPGTPPGIWMAAENLGLATVRSGVPLLFAGIGDELDAADVAFDCNGSAVPDTLDLMYGLATDCNFNGILDSCDIGYGTSKDCNGNGTPDECEPSSVFADLDGDGDVDGIDFLTFSVCYNGALNPPAAACSNVCADLDHDGDVDGIDFLTFSVCYNGALNPPACP